MKSLKELCNEIANHLCIDPLPIKFEDTGQDDSRIYFKEEYVWTNKKYKDNYKECAKCIAHEYRHVFQIFYSQLYNKVYNKCRIKFDKQYNKVYNKCRIKNYSALEL